MTKKKRSTPEAAVRRSSKRFDPETNRYFIPVAFGILLIALVILFSKFIFSDKMLYGSDTINAGIFIRSIYIDFLKQTGSILQWDPYVFGGMPYVEAFNGDIFYPLSILKFFGSIYRMLGWVLFIHIYLAGIFMYLCARQFRLSKVASLIAGVAYMFSPYLVSLVAPGHDGKIFVTTLFPLVILFLERGFRKRDLLSFTVLGVVIGVIIVSPHAQMSYFTLWAVAFYSAMKLIALYVEKKSIVPLIKPSIFVTYAVVIGLLLSAIQFLPGYIYTTKFSPRADAKRGWEWATSWSMHEEEAFSLLIPEFPGISTDQAKTYYWGKNPFKDNSDSTGPVVLFLALFGFFFVRRKESYFFGGLAIFAFLYALADTTPFFRLVYAIVPNVSKMRAPSMIMFQFSFAAALLSGMFIQYLQDLRNKKEDVPKPGKGFNYLLWGLPAFLLLMALLFSADGRGMLNFWSSVFYPEAATTMIQKGVSKLNLGYMNLPAITSGAWLAFVATALTAFFIWLYREKKMGVGILVTLAAVPLLYNAHFDSRFISTFDQNRKYGPNAMVDFFKRQPGDFRVLDLQQPKETILPFHGIQVVVGYHGNQLRWYDDLIGGVNFDNIMRGNKYVLNLTGAKFIILPPSVTLPEGFLGDKPVTQAATFGQSQVIQNDNAFPRVFLVDQYKVYADRKEMYPLITSGADNLRDLVYLEKEPDIELTPASLEGDSTWIVSYSPDSVVVGVKTDTNALLVMTDNYYDAWHVWIDGKPAELLRADGAFRAVPIPKGSSEVLFKYISKRYHTGVMVTLLTCLWVLGILGFYSVRAIRDRQKEETT